MLLNLLLVRLGYPPAIIYKGDRSRYLAALRRADDGDPGPLGEFLARAVLDNLYKFVVPAIAGPARLVPLPALATGELSANALRVAAVRGRLEAAGRRWHLAKLHRLGRGVRRKSLRAIAARRSWNEASADDRSGQRRVDQVTLQLLGADFRHGSSMTYGGVAAPIELASAAPSVREEDR